MTKDILYRPAVPRDAWAIAKVHVDTWRSTYRSIISDEILDNLSYERRQSFWHDQIETLSDPDFIIVAEEKTAGVIGFVSGGKNRDDSVEFKAEIYAIYLNDVFQGCGVGIKLFQRAAQHLDKHGIGSLIVWVLEKNSSRYFYEKLKGSLVAERKIEIGPQVLNEVAYGWKELSQIVKSAR